MSMIFTWFSFKTAYILNQDRECEGTSTMNSDIFRLFGRPVYQPESPNSGAEKAPFKFSFFSSFSTKN